MASAASRLQALVSAYGPSSASLFVGDHLLAEALGRGDALQQRVEALGAQPLAATLAPGERAVLLDAEVTLEIERDAVGAELRVTWTDGPHYRERIAVTGAAALPIEADAAPAPEDRAQRLGPALEEPVAALHDVERPLAVSSRGLHDAPRGALPAEARGRIPAQRPETLGDPGFRSAHGVRGNLIAGAMAGGIGSAEIVIAMAKAGLMGFFGAGGLPLEAVEAALKAVTAGVPRDAAWGFNLLHNPAEPAVEERTVDLYLNHGVTRISASAYMGLTPAVVRFRLDGVHDRGGEIIAPNRVFAKVSRPEVAEAFLRPAPPKIIEKLVADGHLTKPQARLAARIPVAQDLTVEADSGGHTDRRPLVGLLPVMLRLRDRIAAEERYADRGVVPRVGAAGGLGDPASVYAAFAMGAAYVLTGSVNQSTVEAGTSRLAKMMVATAGIADCTTGPAPDMFEMGAHVQVLGQGTLYAQRAGRLYELYRRYTSLDDLPPKERDRVERIFKRPIDDVWADTLAFWQARDPEQAQRAEADPHHKMALVFRWYLGMSSRWARTGEADRRRDFQIWCGPAMGLFNDWVHGTWLDALEARRVADVSWALLTGAAAVRRVEMARGLGLDLPSWASSPSPQRPTG